MDSPTSIVVPQEHDREIYLPAINRSPAIQLEQEGPGPTLTTMLTEFCSCCGSAPSIGDRGFFLFDPFSVLIEGTGRVA